MGLISGYSLFFISLFFSSFAPGYVFLRYLKIFKNSTELFIFSWVSGLCLFILGTYLLSWVGLSQLYLVIPVVCSVICLNDLRTKRIKLPKTKIADYLLLIIIAVGSLSFLAAMFLSGYETSNGLEYIGVNGMDGIRHIAYIKNMTQFFPPQSPALAETQLRGFHYFYDFMLARFAVFYGFLPRDLYFRFFPLFLGFLYGAGFYLFSSLLTKDKVKKNLILFFAYFSQSSLFILILFDRSLDLTDNAVVQPLGLIINPFTVLSIAILLAGLSLLPRLKASGKYALPVGLLLGVLSEIKVYAGLIGIGALGLYTIYCILRSRGNKTIIFNLFSACFLTGVVTAITYLPNNYHAGGLLFTPFLYYSHYLQTDIFKSLHWELKRQVYAAAHNWPRIVLLYLEAIGIFWLVNLGSSLVILIRSRDIFKKSFWEDDGRFILTAAIIIPIVIGSLFIQTVSVFDTVQFFWIAIALIGIPAGIIFGNLYQKSRTVFKIVILLVVLLSSLPGVLDFEKKYLLPPSRRTIEGKYLAVLRSVGQVVPPGKFFIYLPTSDLLPSDTLVVPSVTGRSIYLGEGGLPSSPDPSIPGRQKNQQELLQAIKNCDHEKIKSIMQKIGTPDILVTGSYPCLVSQASDVIASPDKQLVFYTLKSVR